MADFKKHVLRVGAVLGLFAIVATTMVAFTEQNTRQQIKENERQALLDAINTLIPHEQYDNAILQDTLALPKTEELGTEETTQVYRARKQNQPVAVVLTVVAPNGYSGRIKMLVGIYNDGTLAGVRVINHKETPGLGDKIDASRSNWIKQFEGLSLENPSSAKWKVKKDGGAFDQFTGATITPRAVVKAVKASLEYFKNHREALFAQNEEKS
ncbi:MAG: electron transport complex subunit RsxG [Pseudomonadota bacterium]|jgi:Na+-translocating ferredoxin:NAD+ oxidoreductase subunit G|uniref:Ion-translocating oxidoreductase complex subunit G n=1 Tax=Methylophaga aminisulfidivorans MP TaxID=1026882 RepID=F5T1M3_9GAMM|nr:MULTISPECIES: electron transport complex subunit RsxG [Methylophaga]EGL53129.1 putative NADH:ubiquinone oxidoreductase, subunit RnfG [Methylophaga aminisulfidivorans MP]MEC9412444.1 electron transport complex subunit RsxG [Pseudomonadota bacterium]WVI84571.1 electron transport complex subunit RsxG [Methylophaga thalassica]